MDPGGSGSATVVRTVLPLYIFCVPPPPPELLLFPLPCLTYLFFGKCRYHKSFFITTIFKAGVGTKTPFSWKSIKFQFFMRPAQIFFAVKINFKIANILTNMYKSRSKLVPLLVFELWIWASDELSSLPLSKGLKWKQRREKFYLLELPKNYLVALLVTP